MTNCFILEAHSGAKRLGRYLVAKPDENEAKTALAKRLRMSAPQIGVLEQVDPDDFGADEGEIALLDYC
jgi:hypothetical protein